MRNQLVYRFIGLLAQAGADLSVYRFIGLLAQAGADLSVYRFIGLSAQAGADLSVYRFIGLLAQAGADLSVYRFIGLSAQAGADLSVYRFIGLSAQAGKNRAVPPRCNFPVSWQIIQDAVQAVVSSRSLRAKAQCFMDVHSLWPETPDSTSILQKSGWKKSADCTESVYQATASLATARVRESGMPVVTCLIKNIKEFTTQWTKKATLGSKPSCDIAQCSSLLGSNTSIAHRVGQNFGPFVSVRFPWPSWTHINTLEKMKMEQGTVVSTWYLDWVHRPLLALLSTGWLVGAACQSRVNATWR